MALNRYTRDQVVAEVLRIIAELKLLSTAEANAKLSAYQNFRDMLATGETRSQLLPLIHDKLAELAILPANVVAAKREAWKEIQDLAIGIIE